MPNRENAFTKLTDGAKQKIEAFLYGDKLRARGGAMYSMDEPPVDLEPPRRSRRAKSSARNAESPDPTWQQPIYEPAGQYPEYQQAPQQPMYAQHGQYYQQPNPAYQQQYQRPAQQEAYQQPRSQFTAQVEEQRQRNRQDGQKIVNFPGYSAEAPLQQQPQATESVPGANIRVINLRGVNECRSAIALLRAGDVLVVVMDNVGDPAEMRRYVDTLSGACFSLSATITKVSRSGAYLVAPSGVSVFADMVTSQMNGAQRAYNRQTAARQAARQPSYQPYAQPAYQEPQQQNGFEQRAAQQAPMTEFYAQQPVGAPAQPSFEPQQNNGYVPDQYEQQAAQY